ncbi:MULTISPECIES: bifunctional lysylphosphatidylglycerol flippase/synthetase MprF [Streptomyces]|uniref:DUF2156 domain-containing protein n=2 Tax=Streptomyces TaxID=1883 RepID=A0A646KHM8_STRJU|nr:MULTISPECIES: DUF2156 domain-containing protein [Streptomyces]MQS35817.1 DUF2156 domain-containing protein [Streptomyces katsurahamanus]MQT01755.1 DUF2156 domain-containing protein [Streptomyces jumonjinensis]
MAVSTGIGAPVLDAIRTHTRAQNSSSFLAMNRGTGIFTVPGLEGVIAYRRSGRYLVQFGGPFAPPESYEPLLDAFTAFAERKGVSVVGVQLQEYDAKMYAERGFTVNQIGASYTVDLDTFSLRGSRFMQLRNKISRSFRAGLQVEEADPARCEAALKEIDQAWLGTKGAHELEFLIGQIGGAAQEHRRLFLGRIEGRPIGYISYSPVYGGRPGWMHDLSRRLPDGPPGVMEAINVTAIERFTKENVPWLHFGFTPFTGLEERHELPGHSPGFTRLMHFLWENGDAVYPARSQLAYKEKWAPDIVRPQYAAFQGRASVGGFAHIFRACNAF